MAHKIRTLRLPIAPPPKVEAKKPVEKPKKLPLELPTEMPSAGKDYTDILVWIFDAGERVYHLDHRRNLKNKKIDKTTYELNGHKYALVLDRAFRVKWAPWKKLLLEPPYARNISRFFNEVTRSKKVGILYYQEPCKKDCQKCKLANDKRYIELYPNCYPNPIEPMHISRIHQPSGRMMG